MSRPIPMIDDLALDAVTRAEQVATQRLAGFPVVGLDGDVQQRLGRGSHQIHLAGVLVGEGAKDALGELQKKAIAGQEASFTADITTALEIQKVVVVEAAFEEEAARPDHYRYRITLRESPPLPPPAELEPFGGLDGVDLGFDTAVLGDVAGLADDVQSAVEAAGDAVKDLQALASLGDLSLGNPLTPLQDEAGKLAAVGSAATDALGALRALLGGGA
jgi:hypothetical protein